MTDSARSDARAEHRAFRLEVAIIVLLGLAAFGTAWATFQAALYDGKQAGAYSQGQILSTEAESLYLEANQQYTQDSETLTRLAELQITAATDPVAQETIDVLTFMNVSDDLAGAITRANEANAADPSTYTDPLTDEAYQAALFGTYAETSERAGVATADASLYNSLSDRLTLATTVMAIALFLLGIAAVVRRSTTKLALTAGGGIVFVLGAIWTLLVPITWL